MLGNDFLDVTPMTEATKQRNWTTSKFTPNAANKHYQSEKKTNKMRENICKSDK